MNKTNWQALMSRNNFPDSESTYNSLIAHYQQTHRHYHNVTHLEAVLERLEESAHLANDKNAIEIALWFHDIIYKIRSSTNEKDSADWAVQFLTSVGAVGPLSEKVYDLIMATLHDTMTTDNDEKLIVDIDLSILGGQPAHYDLFETNIRKEYRTVPWFIYRKKRAAVLQGFLERDRIYSHDHFYGNLESRARINLENAIASLK